MSNSAGKIIKTMALGSCVGLIIIADNQKIAGMAHVALPDSTIHNGKALQMPGYFADTAIKALLSKFAKYGQIERRKLVVKLIGGANVMDPSNIFNIGKRNVLILRKILWKNRIVPRAEDVGGTYSRTVWVEVGTGRVFASSPGRGEWEI